MTMIRKLAIITLIVIPLLCSLIAGSCCADQVNLSGTDLLSNVSSSLSNSLDEVDRNLSETAGSFSAGSIKTASAETIVAPHRMKIPGWAGVVLVRDNTTLAALNGSYLNQPVEPLITSNPSVQHAIEVLKPGMSNATSLADGDHMILITRPAVIDEKNGAAVVVLETTPFCNAVIRPIIQNSDTTCIVMQSDGTILYASDAEELDKIPPDNFVTEFPTFRDVKKAMMTGKEGHISYELWHADPTEPKGREAYWNTIELHGTEWRVLIAEAIR